MTAPHDPLETLLGSELRDRSDDVAGAGPTFSEVRGRATSIRRRRRAVAGVGVAAALAIVVPLGISTAGSLRSTPDIEPATPREVVHTTLTLEGLERGEAPRIEYFTADGVVLPDSGLQPLDDSLQALVPSPPDDGWLALSPSRDETWDLTENFERTSSEPHLTQTFRSNPDRSLVAWTAVAPQGQGQTLTLHSTTDAKLDRRWNFPATPWVDPVDFLSDDSLVFGTTAPQGIAGIGIAHADGTTSMFEGDWVGAVSASPVTGLVAVQTRSNKDVSGCFGVVDPSVTTAATVWESCDYSLGSFSPDGRYVLASDPYQSGPATSISVLDARTGELVAGFQPQRKARIGLMGIAWESADTFVAVAVQKMKNMIVRFGVDGTLESTVEVVDSDPLGDLAFYLGADRLRRF